VLQPGRDGLNGSLSIYVKRQDRTVEGPFSSSYKLEVFDFTIVDGNDDKIYEFGDTITLTNLKVINKGMSVCYP
jgi:hypothetical protein